MTLRWPWFVNSSKLNFWQRYGTGECKLWSQGDHGGVSERAGVSVAGNQARWCLSPGNTRVFRANSQGAACKFSGWQKFCPIANFLWSKMIKKLTRTECFYKSNNSLYSSSLQVVGALEWKHSSIFFNASRSTAYFCRSLLSFFLEKRPGGVTAAMGGGFLAAATAAELMGWGFLEGVFLRVEAVKHLLLCLRYCILLAQI